MKEMIGWIVVNHFLKSSLAWCRTGYVILYIAFFICLGLWIVSAPSALSPTASNRCFVATSLRSNRKKDGEHLWEFQLVSAMDQYGNITKLYLILIFNAEATSLCNNFILTWLTISQLNTYILPVNACLVLRFLQPMLHLIPRKLSLQMITFNRVRFESTNLLI